MLNRIDKFFLTLDIFGHPIGVNYKGNDTYQTRLGAFFTLATYTLMLINLGTLFTAFFTGSNQDEKNGLQVIDRFYSGPFNLTENNIEISFVPNILPSEILPEYGQFKARIRVPCDEEKLQNGECFEDGLFAYN